MNDADHEPLFRSWLRDYRGIVAKVASSFTLSASDRDDLIQEILLRVWAAMPTYRAEARPGTWIYRIALNRALTWRDDESRSRCRNVPLLNPVDPRETGEGPSEQIEQLYAEIRRLDGIDRSLVLMSLDGCSYREMAEVMGMSESHVGVRLTRARKTLTERLAPSREEVGYGR